MDKRMQTPVNTEFLIRRIGQLWTEAANLPESPGQQRVENLACELSDYVAALHEKQLLAKRSDRNIKSR